MFFLVPEKQQKHETTEYISSIVFLYDTQICRHVVYLHLSPYQMQRVHLGHRPSGFKVCCVLQTIGPSSSFRSGQFHNSLLPAENVSSMLASGQNSVNFEMK